MKIHYALYDKATDMGGARYWSWFEEPLTYELLDRFYGNFAVKNLPNLSSIDLAKFPFSGGIVHIADTNSTKNNGWIVLYRSFYGGERDRGRHGVVILTAWIRANESFEGLLSIFSNDTFKFIEQHSKELPVPAPAALTETKGGKLPEKWQKGLEKIAPYLTPRFDSHLKITDNPTGLDYSQSSAFEKDRAEWEQVHLQKESEFAEQVNALTENIAGLQSHLDNVTGTLNAVRADLDKKRNELNRYRASITETVVRWSAICCCLFFVVMFIVSFAAPNWSVNIVSSVNPFSSKSEPTLDEKLEAVNKKLTGFDTKKEEEKKKLDETLKNFDKDKADEKKKLEDEKKTLESEKQKEQEKQKKEGK